METQIEPRKWSIKILRYPTKADWKRCLYLARGTQGKFDDMKEPSIEWKRKIIRAEHSPIRTLMFTIKMENIPYYSSVHFARHKYGVEHYVQSQRSNSDRGAERQDAPVTHIMDLNLAALIAIMRKRLCNKADDTTRRIADEIRSRIYQLDDGDVYIGFLVTECGYRYGHCPELKPCKNMRFADYQVGQRAGEYASQPLSAPLA